MRFKQLSLLLISVFAVFAFVSCTKNSNQKATNETQEHERFYGNETLEIENIAGDVLIAIAAPLTGPYRELGNSILEGATIAVEEFNKASKKKVGTVIIDDGGIVSEGLARASLVTQENVLGVIGHLNSAISIETSNLYAKNKIASISPASTSPKLTERLNVRGYSFRTIGTDRQLGELAAEFVKANQQFKNIAVLYNDRPYGISVASEFVREMAKSDEQRLVFYQTIPVRTSDHSLTASKIAKTEPDLVFFVGEYNDAGFLLKELKKQLPKIQFLGAEGIHHREFIDIAGTDAEGAIVIGPKVIENKNFESVFKERFGKKPSGYVSSSYKATKILLKAIKEADFKDSEEVAKKVSKNSIFDLNGDLKDSGFSIFKVEDSHFATIGS